MAKRCLVLVSLLALSVQFAAAQDARAVLQAASTAMGAANLKTIQYTGSSGWFGQFGQSFAPGENFPRTDIVSYTRTIDYDARLSREDLTRRQTNPPARGGGVPFTGDQRIVSIVSGNYAWAMQGETANPQPAAAEIRQLEIWMTPHGFLKAAMAGNPTAISRIEVDDNSNAVRKVNVISFTALGKYRVNGQINSDNLLEGVQTWIPDPVLGDMLYEARYTLYKDFAGVKFPTLLHYHRGNRYLDLGHDVLEVTVNNVQPNPSVAALTVPDAVRQAAAAPAVRVESQKLAEGVWMIAGGSHNSVAVEFRDFVAVVEAPLNEGRSVAVIDEVTKLVPNKPIRYLVNTHHHFDHSGGIRTYVAHGATIITHQSNKEFYERVALYPAARTLQPDRLALFPPRTAAPNPPIIETVQQRYVLSDGRRTLELHPVLNLDHTGTMLVAYLPTEKILINADLYSPPAANAPAPSVNPNMTALNRTIQRLKLDVAQHAPIHGTVGTHEQFSRIMAGSRSN